jgi:hypothetical protein
VVTLSVQVRLEGEFDIEGNFVIRNPRGKHFVRVNEVLLDDGKGGLLSTLSEYNATKSVFAVARDYVTNSFQLEGGPFKSVQEALQIVPFGGEGYLIEIAPKMLKQKALAVFKHGRWKKLKKSVILEGGPSGKPEDGFLKESRKSKSLVTKRSLRSV